MLVSEVFKATIPTTIITQEKTRGVLEPGDLVSIKSSCQNPLLNSTNQQPSEVLIFGNLSGTISKPPVDLNVDLDPCPNIDWSSFDENSCKLGWLREQVWLNCDDFFEGGFLNIKQLIVGIICLSLIAISLVISLAAWLFREQS